MSDPERFSIDGVTFQATPTRSGLPFMWKPVIDGIAFPIVRNETHGDRPYVTARVHFGSLLAAGRRAIEYKTAEIERYRTAVKLYDEARARLADHLASEAQR